MSHKNNTVDVDDLLKWADPLTDPPPSDAETEAALCRLVATGPITPPSHARPRLPSVRALASDLALVPAVLRNRVTTVAPIHGRAAATREHRTRVRLLVASAAGGTGALAAVFVLVLGAATSTPAFAVTRNADGTVTVKFHKRSEVSPAEMRALNHALASAHVKSRFVATTSGVTVRCPDGQAARSVTINPTQAVRIGADGSGRPADAAAQEAFANARHAAGKSGAGGHSTRTRTPGVWLRWNCGSR